MRGGGCPRPPRVIDGFLPKLEELVERSKSKIRADVAREKITAMGRRRCCSACGWPGRSCCRCWTRPRPRLTQAIAGKGVIPLS